VGVISSLRFNPHDRELVGCRVRMFIAAPIRIEGRPVKFSEVRGEMTWHWFDANWTGGSNGAEGAGLVASRDGTIDRGRPLPSNRAMDDMERMSSAPDGTQALQGAVRCSAAGYAPPAQ